MEFWPILIGLITAGATIGGTVWAVSTRFTATERVLQKDIREIQASMHSEIVALRGEIKAVDKNAMRIGSELHERINRVKEEYVREDHLEMHLKNIDKSIASVADSAKEQTAAIRGSLDHMSQKLDSVLNTIADFVRTEKPRSKEIPK